MRLIDSDILRAKCIEISEKYENDSDLISRTVVLTVKLIIDLIDFYPKVENDPVVHGHWTCSNIDKYELSYGCYGYIPQLKCSFCERTADSYMRYDKPIMPEDMDGWNYCPNCGAKMDGKVEYNDRAQKS